MIDDSNDSCMSMYLAGYLKTAFHQMTFFPGWQSGTIDVPVEVMMRLDHGEVNIGLKLKLNQSSYEVFKDNIKHQQISSISSQNLKGWNRLNYHFLEVTKEKLKRMRPHLILNRNQRGLRRQHRQPEKLRLGRSQSLRNVKPRKRRMLFSIFQHQTVISLDLVTIWRMLSKLSAEFASMPILSFPHFT